MCHPSVGISHRSSQPPFRPNFTVRRCLQNPGHLSYDQARAEFFVHPRHQQRRRTGWSAFWIRYRRHLGGDTFATSTLQPGRIRTGVGGKLNSNRLRTGGARGGQAGRPVWSALDVNGVCHAFRHLRRGCSLADTLDTFVFFRLVGGIGVGAAAIVSPLYISETAPAAWRGRLVSLYQLAIVFGILLAYFCNYAFANIAGGWRWMFAAQTFPALIFVCACLRCRRLHGG